MQAQENAKPFVIPSLQQWKGGTGHLTVRKYWYLQFDGKNTVESRIAGILQEELRSLSFVVNTKKAKPSSKANFLQMEQLRQYDSSLGTEGYRLEIGGKIAIRANTYRGLFWGTRSLLQLLEQERLSMAGLPYGTALDFPKFASRGFILDDGRKFFPLEFLKRYVKMLSYYKISEFQIHLNDNGFKKYFNNNWDSTYAGFALESSTYPQLNQNGQFYTKKEFIALQRLAQSYGVDIIPEIDVPAHALAITRAIPEIGSRQYGMDHLDLSHPKTMEVVDSIYKEYLAGPQPVFIGPYVHIGTDEYAKAEAERFRAFTDHLIKYVQGYGKQVRAWGALTHAAGKTPVTSKDVTLNIWYNGYADPLEMKKLGYKLISTPDGFLYIVPAAGYYYDYLNLPFLYKSWTPLNVGNITFQAGDTSLIGGSFAIWNDVVGNGITALDVQNRVFPALQVLSEKMWSNTTDTADFKRFEKLAKGIGESPGSYMNGYPISRDEDSTELSAVIWNQDKDGLVIDDRHAEKRTNLEHLGLNYKVSFDLNMKYITAPTPLFTDSVWNTGIYLLPDRSIEIRRENYRDTFAYSLPLDQSVHISILGDNRSVTLSANGQQQSSLAGYRIPKSARDTMFYSQTLSFPFQKIGDKHTPIHGTLRNLKVVVFRKLVLK